jgi:hypothetical protein
MYQYQFLFVFIIVFIHLDIVISQSEVSLSPSNQPSQQQSELTKSPISTSSCPTTDTTSYSPTNSLSPVPNIESTLSPSSTVPSTALPTSYPSLKPTPTLSPTIKPFLRSIEPSASPKNSKQPSSSYPTINTGPVGIYDTIYPSANESPYPTIDTEDIEIDISLTPTGSKSSIDITDMPIHIPIDLQPSIEDKTVTPTVSIVNQSSFSSNIKLSTYLFYSAIAVLFIMFVWTLCFNIIIRCIASCSGELMSCCSCCGLWYVTMSLYTSITLHLSQHYKINLLLCIYYRNSPAYTRDSAGKYTPVHVNDTDTDDFYGENSNRSTSTSRRNIEMSKY